MGLPGTNPFYVPCFLLVGNRFYSASLTFPEFQRADSSSFQSEKEGDAETKESWGTILVPQGIYITTYLWVLQELRPPPRWRMEWWWWPSWFQSTKAWTLLTLAPVLCWILLCSSPHPEYASTLSLKLFREKLLWGRFLVFSLLSTSNESFLLPSFGLVVSIGSTLTKRQTQFSGNKFGNSGRISLS